ncbi:MAG: hypothetical protein PHI11_12620, partial [Gallionella sp.]|nr:hypothetical protein [Gallionella sp.]
AHPPIPLHAVTSFQDFFDFYTQFDFHLLIVCYFSGFSKAMGISGSEVQFIEPKIALQDVLDSTKSRWFKFIF